MKSYLVLFLFVVLAGCTSKPDNTEIQKGHFEQRMKDSKERLQDLKDSLDHDAKMKKLLQ